MAAWWSKTADHTSSDSYDETTDYSDDEATENTKFRKTNSDSSLIWKRRSSQYRAERLEKRRGRSKDICRRHFLLALSVGIWVAVFGLPEFCVLLSYNIFGQRGSYVEEVRKQVNLTGVPAELSDLFRDKELMMNQLAVTCPETQVGKMVNIAETGEFPHLVPWNETYPAWDESRKEDIWCGVLPSAFLAYWPNVAQLIIFTVYKTTGDTINMALQGVVGTVLAVLNMRLMTTVFPSGGRAFPCIDSADSSGRDEWVVLWFSSSSSWHSDKKYSLSDAWWAYNMAPPAGLTGKAIFTPDGSMHQWGHWFQWGWEQKFLDKYKSMKADTCKPGETMNYKDPNYRSFGKILSWFDLTFVLFLFLISNSAKNTIMFGMSWHIFFMMNFMNPDVGVVEGPDSDWYDTDYFVVLTTTILGVIVAMIATGIPKARLTNVGHLVEDLDALSISITHVWQESVEYLTGSERSAKRFQIETQIDALSGKHLASQEHLDGAWWETFDVGRKGRMRRLMAKFSFCAMDIKEILYVVKNCVLTETFEGEHNDFMSAVADHAKDLLKSTQELMWICASSCTDGRIDEYEVLMLESARTAVKEKQVELMKAFHKADPKLSSDLSEEELFLFALSMWAKKTTDLVDKVVEVSQDSRLDEDKVGPCRAMIEGLRTTWDPKKMFTRDHIMFAFRNWLSIMVTFVMAYVIDGSMFDRYSPVMPMTLSLLMVNDGAHHVEYEKSTHRLLGVTLGKSLPIILVGCIDYFPCISTTRLVLQFTMVLTFVTIFTFVYFNSDMWSYVGCLIAGFGVYQLMVPCSSQEPDKLFASKYKELGCVIVAIFVQAIVQALFSCKTPRFYIEESTRKTMEGVEGFFEGFFEADVNKMQSALQKAGEQLFIANKVAPECHPRLQVVRGRSAPFKVQFCESTLRYLQTAMAEAAMILAATKDWVANRPIVNETDDKEPEQETSDGILEILGNCVTMGQVKAELTATVSLISQVLPDMLADTSDNVQHSALHKPEEVRAAERLESAELLYKELAVQARSYVQSGEDLTGDLRVRLTIVVRSLQNLAYHLSKIEELCIKEANAEPGSP